jgi:hypothetical protein
MACFARCGDDNFARALEKHGLLDFYALGTRRGTKGVPPEHTRLQPLFGLLNYIFAVTLPPFQAESCRFRTFGLFDRWVRASISLPASPSRMAPCAGSNSKAESRFLIPGRRTLRNTGT